MVRAGQKAPSAKRRIKTRLRLLRSVVRWAVRKHRAPKGALRPIDAVSALERCSIGIRRHRAPNGALGPVLENLVILVTRR